MQDLEFPAACHRLKLTPDGQYLFASGTHAPRVRRYAVPPQGGQRRFTHRLARTSVRLCRWPRLCLRRRVRCVLQVRVYELSQLSLKFERHFDAEIVEFQARSQHLSPCGAALQRLVW